MATIEDLQADMMDMFNRLEDLETDVLDLKTRVLDLEAEEVIKKNGV